MKAALAVLAFAACDPMVHVGDSPPAPALHPQLDVLLVVNDGPGAARVQRYLVNGFPYFLYGLRFARTQLPDLRIGVVSTSMGAGAFTQTLADCAHSGDGRFTGGGWLAVHEHEPDPVEDFAKLVTLGENGCRFPQPLAAAVAGLARNDGFLRDDAHFAIVYATDVDDCSVPADSQLFDPALESFGPLSPFRCAAVGVACDGQPLPRMMAGPLANCEPNDVVQPLLDPTHALVPTTFYRQALGSIKRDPHRFTTVAFTDMFDPMTLSIDPGPNLTPACHLPDGSTWQPQVRLAAATDMHVPVCQGYGYEMMSALGYMLGTWMYQPPHVD
jgi:hypothetical protein